VKRLGKYRKSVSKINSTAPESHHVLAAITECTQHQQQGDTGGNTQRRPWEGASTTLCSDMDGANKNTSRDSDIIIVSSSRNNFGIAAETNELPNTR